MPAKLSIILLLSQIVSYNMALNKNGRDLYVSASGNTQYKTIQQAIDAAKPGDTVHIREGTYSEQIILKNSGVAFEGDKAIIKSSDRFCVIMNKVSGVSFKGLIFQGGSVGGLIAYDSNNLTFDSLTITGCPFYGIGLRDGTTNCVIADCNIFGCKDGISFANGVKNTTIKSSHIHDCNRDGIVMTAWTPTFAACEDITIQDNEINNVGRQGMLVVATKRALIKLNRVHHCGATGIQIEGDPRKTDVPICGNITIEDNLCEDNAQQYAVSVETGIWVDDSNDVVVQRNTLRRNGKGLSITGCYNVTAKENKIYGNKLMGLFIDRSHQRPDWGGILIEKNTIGGGYEILHDDDKSRVTMKDNEIDNYQIYHDEGGRVTFKDNFE